MCDYGFGVLFDCLVWLIMFFYCGDVVCIVVSGVGLGLVIVEKLV